MLVLDLISHIMKARKFLFFDIINHKTYIFLTYNVHYCFIVSNICLV